MRAMMFVPILLFVVHLSDCLSTVYNANWASLDSRPLPSWFDEAKFGIVNHWGLYSANGLPCWFWYDWKINKNPEAADYMNKNFPPNFTYADFGSQFKAQYFDPDHFADVIKRSGAKYYILTAKHVEGYTMYPSKYAWNWNSVDVGPNRDFTGELRKSVEKLGGVRFGLFYSQMNAMNPIYLQDANNKFKTNDFPTMVSQPQLREIVTLYKPEIIWSTNTGSGPAEYWNSTNFLAWLYNSSPVKDTVVVNDIWGTGTQGKHGGFYGGRNPEHKWAKMVSLHKGWSWRANRTAHQVTSTAEILLILARTVSCGGNMFLNFGPTGYGTILPIIEERLTQIGKWLENNGDAIYGTKPWIYQNEGATIWYTSKVKSDDGLESERIFNPQTEKNTIVYAIVTYQAWPKDGVLKLKQVKITDQTKMYLLGYGPVSFKPEGGSIEILLNTIPWKELPSLDAWAIKMEYLQDDGHVPEAMGQKFENYDETYPVF